jgi:preprotein translocase subunit YajC
MLYAIVLFAQQVAEKVADKQEPSIGDALRGILPPILLIGVMFYFMFVIPQRREKRMRDEMMNRLKKNDRVITNAGIIATVTNIKDEEVTLRIDDTSNARLTVLRSSIGRILTGQEQAKDNADKAPAAGTTTNVKAS